MDLPIQPLELWAPGKAEKTPLPPVGQTLPREKGQSWVCQSQFILPKFTNLTHGSTFLGPNQPRGREMPKVWGDQGSVLGSRSEVGKKCTPLVQGPCIGSLLGQICPATWIKQVLLKHSHMPMCIVLSMATTQSWIVATVTMAPAKPKTVTICPFTENACQHLLWCLTANGGMGLRQINAKQILRKKIQYCW